MVRVGSAGALSYYGTLDQGGNVWEWNEAVTDDSHRGMRGGSWFDIALRLTASNSIKQFLLAVAMAAILLGLLRGLWDFVAGPVLPQTRLRQLRPGLTKPEVDAILGSPQAVVGDRSWVYSRPGNPGWVEVHFNASGRLDWVNDESPFP